jgi:hypothetical protein
MPQPNSQEVHIDGPLTTLSVSYLQDPGMFIADSMFPRIPVNHQSDKYYVYDIGDMYRNNMAPRGDATESAGATYTHTTQNYNTELFALHKMVSKRTVANSDAALNPMQTAVKWLTQQERIKRDVEFAAKFLTTGIWDTDVTVATPVDDAASDPIGMISDQQLTVLGNTGFEPRTLAVTAKGWKELKNHPDIIGRLSGGANSGAPAIATRQSVAALLDVDEIVVTSGVVNSAAEGVTDSVGFITTGDALLCYVDPNPGLDSITAGATFVYTGDLGQEGRTIGTIEEPLKKATRVEIEAEWSMNVVASSLGVFFSGFVS